MEIMAGKRIGSHRLCYFSRQKGVSLIPALITICIFTILTTKVVIPKQNRDLRESHINAVANSAEKLVQASYAYRAASSPPSWPKGIANDNPKKIPPLTVNDVLVPTYLPVFNKLTPWGDKWVLKINTTTGNIYFETDTNNEDIARELIQKIGSYAQLANKTKVQIFPVKGAPPSVNIDELTVTQDITVGRNIILKGQIMASNGSTVLFDASNHPNSSSAADGTHYHSSQRFKEHVAPLDTPIKSIYQLKPVSFDYKNSFKHYKTPNAANKEIGLIAEQVLPLIPEITLIDDDKAVGIDYTKLSILLLKAIQELKDEIVVLQANNQKLKHQMERLNSASIYKDDAKK